MGKRCRLHSAGVEEVGESSERRGRGGHKAVWKRRGLSHPDGMGSGAKGSSPNVGTRSGASTGGARIRETRAEQARASERAQPSGHPGASLSDN